MEIIFIFMGIEYHRLSAIMCTSFIIVLCQMRERENVKRFLEIWVPLI